MYVLVACVIVCVDLMMMSSAYEVTCTDACGRGVADVHRLNSMGEFAYCGCVVSECCVSFAYFDIVCSEFDVGGWDVCL